MAFSVQSTPARQGEQVPREFAAVAQALDAAALGPPAIAIAVSVASRGAIAWEAGFGFSDAEGSQPVTAATPFAVGSIAKTATATAIVRLADRGVLDLDRDVAFYLPGEVRVLLGDQSRLTVAALASMTGGIPHLSRNYWRDDAATAPGAEALVREFGVAVFPPGESFHYSNLSFGVLERVIEKVTGRPFDAVVEQEVFTPLGMANTFFATPRQTRRYAVRLSSDGQPVSGYVFTEPEGGAGLVASAHDLALFGAFHAGRPIGAPPILSPGSLQRMQRTVHPEAGYGLGMYTTGYSLVFDGAVTGGAGMVKVIPAEELAVAVVTNAVTNTPATYAFMDRLLDAVLSAQGRSLRREGRPSFFARTPFVPPESILGAWEGVVRHPGGLTTIRLAIGRDGITAAIGGGAPTPVTAVIDEGRLRFDAVGDVESGARDGITTHRLHLSPDRLSGFVQAGPTPRGGLAFPRPIEFSRVR